MYFFSGEATCLKLMPACAVMSVKDTLIVWVGAGETSRQEIKNPIENRMAVRVMKNSLRVRVINYLWPVPFLSSPSRARADPRLLSCGRRRCRHGPTDSARAADRV